MSETLATIITFPSTTEALKAEECAYKNSLSGRLIPIPSIIKKGCGMGWKTSTSDKEKTLAVFDNSGVSVEGVYEMYV